MNKKGKKLCDTLKKNSGKETTFVKLPKLEIAKLSGKNNERWTFWSTFQKAIH